MFKAEWFQTYTLPERPQRGRCREIMRIRTAHGWVPVIAPWPPEKETP